MALSIAITMVIMTTITIMVITVDMAIKGGLPVMGDERSFAIRK
jgi:hypothetical protein